MEEQNKNQGNPPAEEKKSNTGRILLIVLLLISLIFNFYQWYDRGKQADNYDTTIDSLTIDKAEVERVLELTKSELEQYRGRSEQLDSLLNDANDKIGEKEKTIRALLGQKKRSEKENAELRMLLTEMTKLKDQYLEEIDRLITENKRLQSENDSLSVELNNNVSTRNKLEARLKVAEQLRVDRVTVTPYKKRMIGGKMVSTSLAKRAEKIDACFTLLENAVAKRGEHLLSLRLVAPDGKALAGTSNGSFVNSETGQETPATANYQANFDGSSQEICMSWEDEGTELAVGEYGVEIYIDGSLIFASTFKLE